MKSIKELVEIGGYEQEAIAFKEYKEIPDKLYELINRDRNNVSIQIYILAEILKYFYDNGIDLYDELVRGTRL